jgi:membrane peptidoglycan carboxypeptidase
MLSPYIHESAFGRRPDRSLGWAAMESAQAAALARSFSLLGLERSPDLPPELLPFPPLSKARRGWPGALALGLAWVLALHLCYIAGTCILIAVYAKADPSATVLMAYRKWGFGWKLQEPRPLPIKRIPAYVRAMLVSVEDDKFYEHHGIELEAFKRAEEINRRLGKPLYGGSTLTMQVARTLFLVPEKLYFRKYLEIIAALELEAILPKSRILELYFGYAEWGKGVFGIEAAARKYYGRGIQELSRDEAARLIALLSSPIRYNPDTLHRSLILRERYEYLYSRFVVPKEAEASALANPAQAGAPATPPEAGLAPPEAGLVPPEAGLVPPEARLAPPEAGLAQPEPELPPPSPEPGAELSE